MGVELTAREAIMLRINEGRAFTARGIAETGFSVWTVKDVIREVKKKGLCHVLSWERLPPRRLPQAVFVGGPGEDAPIPPLDREQARLRKNKRQRQYSKDQRKNHPYKASKERKTKYGMRSYKLDKVLQAMEDGRVMSLRQAAELVGANRFHFGRMIKRAKEKKWICIYEWDTSRGGGEPFYGWRHEGMEDAPRPKKGARDQKRNELKQTARQWGWFYGQPAAV